MGLGAKNSLPWPGLGGNVHTVSLYNIILTTDPVTVSIALTQTYTGSVTIVTCHRYT